MATQPRSWGTSDDIQQYRRDIAKFLERLAVASENNPPPAMNAANGFFVKAVREDAEIKSVAPPRRTPDDPEGQRVFNALWVFESGVLAAFNTENAHGDITNKSVAWEAFQKLKGPIGDTIKAIGDLVVSRNAESIVALGKSINDLIDKVDHAGMVYKGDHANGHIQSFVHNAADQLKTAMVAVRDTPAGPNSDPFARKFAKTLVEIIDPLLNLNFNNDPWLVGDWQVSFQAIARAGSITLNALQPDPPAPAPAAP